MRNKKQFLSKTVKYLAILVAVVAMIAGTVLNNVSPVLATNKIADTNTVQKYNESLGDDVSTDYAGRVWTDKSVFEGDAIFEDENKDTTISGADIVVTNPGTDDFLVSFSALATSKSVSGETNAPIDVVFVIDISGSMTSAMDDRTTNNITETRIYNTIKALNTSIDTLMDLNDYTRVAVVAFSDIGTEVLPLDHYEKVTRNGQEVDYFTFYNYQNSNGTTNDFDQLYVQAMRCDNNDGKYDDLYRYSTGSSYNRDYSIDVTGGTNIQMGMYTGMNILANLAESDTKVTINGTQVQRIPSVILLSDGAPTYSSDSSSWWAPSNNANQGPGTHQRTYGSDIVIEGNGVKAIMTASYMKDAIDRKYFGSYTTGKPTNYKTTVYTVGMGITNLSGEEQKLAQATLNPAGYIGTSAGDNSTIITTIEKIWEKYNETNNTRQNIVVGDRSNNSASYDEEYSLTHPTTGYDIKNNDRLEYSGLYYVDKYNDANSASSVTDVFKDIVNSVTINTAEVPTEMNSENALTDGYLTYTDPIGEYMEVKDIKTIIFNGKTYAYNGTTDPKVDPETNIKTTTYEFAEDQKVTTAIHGEQSLKSILIQVVSTPTSVSGIYSEELTIQIPAALIPLRINTVQLSASGAVEKNESNNFTPIRIVYSVGLQNNVKVNDVINTEVVSKEYIDNNSVDGVVNFYTNMYSGDTIEGTTTSYGNARVVFEPSHSNPFYYMQEDTVIYHDSALTNPVLASERLEDDTTYYYPNSYYYGNQYRETYIARTGAQLTSTELTQIVVDGKTVIARKAGTPRLNRVALFEGAKNINGIIGNLTETADEFYHPVYHQTDEVFNGDGHFDVYLGNNGKIGVPVGAYLEISKEITLDDPELEPKDATFTFNVTLKDATNAAVTGTFGYVVTDAEGKTSEEKTIVITDNGGTIQLKAGEKATIEGLPGGATYAVAELVDSMPGGFQQDSESNSTGQLEAGKTKKAEFVNKYSVSELKIRPTSVGLTAGKKLTGRTWNETDSFTFVIESRSIDTPMPVPTVNGFDTDDYELTTVRDSHKSLALTISKESIQGTKVGNADVSMEDGKENGVPYSSVNFGFGEFTFTKPGTYEYVVYEQIPATEIPGVSYCDDMYEVDVVVKDNGDGTLSIDSVTMNKVTNSIDSSGNPQTTLTPTKEALFVNEYSRDEQTWTPLGTKVYTDHSGQNKITNGMFDFEVKAVGAYLLENDTVTKLDEKVPMPTEANGQTSYIVPNADTQVLYDSITYTSGMLNSRTIYYVYKLSEVIPSGATENTLNGMRYDPTVYTVVVKVGFDANGLVEVTPTYYNNNIDSITKDVLTGTSKITNTTFTNSYDPTDTDGIDLFVNKEISGREWLNNETYKFNLTTTADTSEVTIPSESYSVTVTKESKTGTFEDIIIHKAGTYTFIITEDLTNTGADASNNFTSNGITYDTHESLVTVEVVDINGKLTVKEENGIVYSDNKDGDRAKFVNKYTATFDDSTAISLSGEKTLTGKPLTHNSYFFEIEATYKAPGSSEAKEITVTPNIVSTSGQITITNQDGVERNEASIDLLKNVKYDKVGTYTYKITEELPNEANSENSYTVDGVKYDTSEYIVVVEVTENQATGKISASIISNNSNDIVFNNEYSYSALVVSPLELTKVMEGNAYTLKAGQFTFVKELIDENGRVYNNGSIVFDTNGDNEFTSDDNDRDIATNNADGSINFNKIQFSKAGTYTVRVYEQPKDADGNNVEIVWENNGITIDGYKVNGEVVEIYERDGITYDKRVLIMTNTIIDNGNGQLVVERSATNGIRYFSNTYNSTGVLVGETNLLVTKNYNQWKDGNKFAFTLQADPNHEETVNAVSDSVITFENNRVEISKTTENSSASFGNITFTKPGQYRFLILEEAPEVGQVNHIPGVVYDITPRYVTVEVTENSDQNGELNVKITSIKSGVTNEASNITLEFINTYTPEKVVLDGHTNLVVNKNFTGRHDDNPNNAANWLSTDSFTFELVADPNDENTTEALAAGSIVIMDDKDEANDGNVTLKVTNPTGRFHFGNIEFIENDSFNFGNEEVFRFLVTENVNSNTDGITYDTKTRVVEVKVSDNGNGLLEIISHRVLDLEGKDSSLTFTNTYTTKDTRLDGETNLLVTKVVEGLDEWGDYSFTFTLEGNNELTIEGLDSNDPFVIVEPENDEDNNPMSITITEKDSPKAFGDIVFKKAGDYSFKVTEVNEHSSNENINYDENEMIINVKVTDDNNGNLVCNTTGSVVVTGSTFTNIYTPTPLDIPVNGKKIVTGRSEWNGTDIFEFTIERAESEPSTTPLPGETIVQNKKTDIEFGTIHFTEKGTYKYVISETGGFSSGVINDTGKLEVTIEIGQEPTGALVHKGTTYTKVGGPNDGAEVFEFVNTYNPSATDPIAQISAMKSVDIVEGFVYSFEAEQFEFTLTPDVNNPISDPITGMITVTNDANGNAIFKENVIYTEAGTYKYYIREVNNGIPGMHYDGSVYTMTVVVTDNTAGKLETSVTYEKTVARATSEVTASDIKFTNRYEPPNTELSFDGIKYISGINIDNAEVFTFRLTGLINGTENNWYESPMPTGSVPTGNTKTNINSQDSEAVETINEKYIETTNNSSIFLFGDIEFSKPGEYKYTIEEIAGDAKGYTYDSTKYEIVVTVVDENGILKATADVANEDIIFNNSYKPDSVVINDPTNVETMIETTKKLEGREIVDGEFKFVLKDKDGNIVKGIEGEDVIGTNTGTKVSFPEFEIDSVGTHLYTISEMATGKNGVTYDLATTYSVVIEVVDKVDDVAYQGQLSVESISYFSNNEEIDADNVIFNNTYNPQKTTVGIGLTKVLEGRSIKDGEFEFVIKDADGNVVKKAANVGNEVLFENIEYNQIGTYTYTISEVKGEVVGVTYDEKVYEITVEVIDNENGNLVATVSGDTDFVFTNVYKATSTSVDITATKKVTGDKYELKGEDFEFELKDASGNVIGKTTNAKDGTIVFEDVAFDKAGTYNLTISEVKGKIENMVYDTTEHNVTVKVVDDGKGTLTATVESEKVVIENKYTDLITETGDEAPVALYAGILGISAIGLGALFVAKKKKRDE